MTSNTNTMQRFVERMQNGMFRLRFQSGEILDCNDYFARMFGKDAAEGCRGKNFGRREFTEEGLYARLKAGLFIKDMVSNFLGNFNRNNGEEFRGKIDAWYLKDEEVIEGIIYDMTDIDAEKDAGRYYEGLYRSLTGILDQAYVIITEGKIAEANRRFHEMFGMSKDSEEFADLKITDIAVEKHRDNVSGRIKKLNRRNKLSGEFRFTARKTTGEEFDAEASFVWMTGRGGALIHGLIWDNLEIANLEQKLLQSQKMEAVGRMASGVSHDFNNLLTAIIGHTDLAVVSAELGRDPLRDLEVVQQAADKASILTRQLLSFSRKQRIEPKIICLNALLSNMDKMLRRIIGENVNLVSMQDEDLRRVKVDPGQIEQIVVNLAVNARDALSSGGKITLATQNVIIENQLPAVGGVLERGSYVRLTVEDTGSGMSEEVLAKAFDPFYTTKPEGKGTGLGLSTVQDIVDQNSGRIRLFSEVGKGTRIEFYFPMILDEAEDYTIEKARSEMPGGNESILVVEDEESVLDYTVKLLKMLGYSVVEAKNGVDAIKVYKSAVEPFDLVLTDLIMPDMNGVELTKTLLANEPVKVIYMSGYRPDSFIHEILDPETPYIQKPFYPTALAKMVREVLDK